MPLVLGPPLGRRCLRNHATAPSPVLYRLLHCCDILLSGFLPESTRLRLPEEEDDDWQKLVAPHPPYWPWWDLTACPDHRVPVLQLGRAFTIVPAWRGSIIVSLWSGGPPPSVPNPQDWFLFFSPIWSAWGGLASRLWWQLLARSHY